MEWFKGLFTSAKDYLLGALFLFASGLLVALKLKDSQMHEFQVKAMEDSAKAALGAEDAKVAVAKKEYEENK